VSPAASPRHGASRGPRRADRARVGWLESAGARSRRATCGNHRRVGAGEVQAPWVSRWSSPRVLTVKADAADDDAALVRVGHVAVADAGLGEQRRERTLAVLGQRGDHEPEAIDRAVAVLVEHGDGRAGERVRGGRRQAQRVGAGARQRVERGLRRAPQRGQELARARQRLGERDQGHEGQQEERVEDGRPPLVLAHPALLGLERAPRPPLLVEASAPRLGRRAVGGLQAELVAVRGQPEAGAGEAVAAVEGVGADAEAGGDVGGGERGAQAVEPERRQRARGQPDVPRLGLPARDQGRIRGRRGGGSRRADRR
jgi:hypothetical protein